MTVDSTRSDNATALEPRDTSVRQTILEALDSAIRAPSTHNTQPWIFGIEDDPAAVTLHADTTRALEIADPSGRELFISCGTLLHHLRVALAARGRACRVERLPDPSEPTFVARVTIGDAIAVTEGARSLEAAIHERHTDNGVFERGELDESMLNAVAKAVDAEGAKLALLLRDDERARVADLVAVADRSQQEDPQFRDELAQWLRLPIGGARDGITVRGPRGLVEPWIVRTFDRGDGEAARDRALIFDGSPCVALLTTVTDTQMDWIRAGEALSAALLCITDEGLSASYFAQVVEVDSTRAALAALADGRVVQVVLRIGRGHSSRRSARRPVREMLR